MPRLTLWNGPKFGNTYNFIDKKISQYFGMSGTAIYIHKLLGPYPQNGSGQGNATTTPAIDTPWVSSEAHDLFNSLAMGTIGSVQTSTAAGTASTLAGAIQDPLFLQNKDNKYDPTTYEMRMVYQIADSDFDLTQFGYMSTDVVYGEVHYNDMIALLGRKIYPGDVIELPHQRDSDLYDPHANAINRFYVVQDSYRAADGYSATWFAHIWRFKMTPMPATQEYADILNGPLKDAYGIDIPGTTTGGAISTLGTQLQINQQVVLQAEERVFKKNFETRQFYVVPGDEGLQNPWVFAGDGIPPNGATLLGSGSSFPSNPSNGEYFLRTDYYPHMLFKFYYGWKETERNYRLERWDAASSMLLTFINNNTTVTNQDGTTSPEKQPLWRALAPPNDPQLFPDKVAIWNALPPTADL